MIRYLVKKATRVPVSDVAKYLHINNRTVYEDIRRLQDILPEGSIDYSNHEVELQLPSNYTVDNYFDVNEELDRIRNLFQILFKHPQSSIEDLASELNLGSTSVYRLIKKINRVFLKRFNLKMTTSPFDLEGDERQIRSFYSQFFYESFDKRDWPFNENYDLQFRINDYIQFILKFLDLPFEPDFSQYHYMRIHSYISIIRTVQGHLVHIDNQVAEDFNKMFPDYLFKEIGEDYLNFVDLNDKRMTAEEASRVLLPQTFYHYLNSNICSSYQDFFNKMSLPFVNESYKQLTQIVETIHDRHNYHLEDSHQLILGLHNVMCLDLSVQNATHIYDSRKHEFLDRIKQLDSDFFNDVKAHILYYVEDMLGEEHEPLTLNLIFTFYTYWPDFYRQLLSKQEKIRILFLNDLDQKYAHEIMNFFQHFFINNCEFHLFDGITYDEFLEVEKDYDVIISTFGIDATDDKPVLVIRDFPSRKDILNLQKIILDLTSFY